MKKAGASDIAPLTLGSADGGAWVTFESPTYSVPTYSAQLLGREGSFIFTVLAKTAADGKDEEGEEARSPLAVTSHVALRCEDAGL
jgi:hypothetical protein